MNKDLKPVPEGTVPPKVTGEQSGPGGKAAAPSGKVAAPPEKAPPK